MVWIDGGLHATETLGAQQLVEHVWQMVSRTDDETLRFLDDVIQLCVLVNPDGMDLVSDWYMKHGQHERFPCSTTSTPGTTTTATSTCRRSPSRPTSTA